MISPRRVPFLRCASLAFFLTTKQMCEIYAQALCCQIRKSDATKPPCACNCNAMRYCVLQSFQFKLHPKAINLAPWSRVMRRPPLNFCGSRFVAISTQNLHAAIVIALLFFIEQFLNTTSMKQSGKSNQPIPQHVKSLQRCAKMRNMPYATCFDS